MSSSLFLVSMGCGENILWVDPPVELERVDAGGTSGTEPKLTLGIFREQFFTRLEPGAALPIIAGFQGGDWVMPSIRADVITGAVVADASVTMSDEPEVVGVLEAAEDRLQPTAEGNSEIVGLPIPIRHQGASAQDPIDDLYDRPATLEVTLTDGEGRSATESIEVQLVQD